MEFNKCGEAKSLVYSLCGHNKSLAKYTGPLETSLAIPHKEILLLGMSARQLEKTCPRNIHRKLEIFQCHQLIKG